MVSKNHILTRKIIIAIFLIVNLLLVSSFPTTLFPSLIQRVSLYAMGCFAFGDSVSGGEILTAFIIGASEVICLPSLFTGKSKYKIISNIILQIMCIADICWCSVLIFKQVEITIHIFEILIDLLFMGLVLYDLAKVYNIKLDKIFKNKKFGKPKHEQNEAPGDDFLH